MYEIRWGWFYGFFGDVEVGSTVRFLVIRVIDLTC